MRIPELKMTVLSPVASFFYAETFAERHAEPLRFFSLVDSFSWAWRGRHIPLLPVRAEHLLVYLPD